MKAAATVPGVVADLGDLGSIVEHNGPFLTVYLSTDGTVENAAIRSEQRWKTLRRQAAHAGAPEDVLGAIDPLVGYAHLEGAVLAVVSDATRVMLTDHLDEPLEHDRGSWSRLPDLVPLIRSRQSRVPYVLALADRGGADLTAEGPGGSGIERSTGDDDPERKVHPGGWSQPRYQQRAENDWAGTAADTAAEVARLSDTVDARLIILGGDVRATHMIRDGLPAEMVAKVRLIDQGRATDGSEDARDREIHRLVATAGAEDTVAVLEKFKEERGQQDRAVEGVEATVDALNRAAVDVLLVHDDARGQTTWVGPQPVPIRLDRSSITADDSHLQEAALVDALVRAALGTGASVRVIPKAGPVHDGIGALLRWSNPST